MTPILFEENETSFTTLGIGALTDAIMCKINRVLNGVDELTLQYPVNSKRYSDIKLSRIIYAQPEFLKDSQPYRIYYISTPLRGVITVFARHISEQRNYIPVKPFSASSISEVFTKLPTMMVESNPFTFWTDKTTSANFNLTVPTSLGQVLGGMEGSILDTYRGEYEFDKWTVKLWNHRGEDCGVTVRYGKNMTDFVKNDSIDSTITGIVPYWSDMDGNIVTLPEYAVQSAYADSYPFRRTVVVDFSADFEEAPTITQLRSRAQMYITSNNIGLPTLSLKVSFEQLSQYPEYADYKLLDTTNLGDTIRVIHEDYDVSVSARVVETEYDCLLEKYKSVTIGSVKSSLESSIKQTNDATTSKIGSVIKESTSFVRTKVDEATKMITGVDGGYVVMHLDANNKPYELLIMDTEDISTAQSVWRFNKNGWGHSSTGYSGPYTMAATIDGGFIADFITAGTMLANRIKGGTLELGGADNGNGILKLRDADNTVITTLDRTGISTTRLVASDYIFVNGTSSSYLNIPMSNSGLSYFRISRDGYVIHFENTAEFHNSTLQHSSSAGGSLPTVTLPMLEFVYDDGANKWVSWVAPTEYTVEHVPSAGGSVYREVQLRAGYLHMKDTSGGGTITCDCRTKQYSFYGNFNVYSGTKSRVVETEDYANRCLYCYETPSPLFGDVGEGQIGEDGACYVWLDPIFAETIVTNQYQVFLQKYGAGECYISERKAGYFVVTGTPSLKFGWELKAKQADFDQKRLESDEFYSVENKDYGELAYYYLQELNEGRIIA